MHTGHGRISGTTGDGRGLTCQNHAECSDCEFLNPGPYLGWSLVIGPLFLKGWKEYPGYGFAALAGFYVTMLLTNAAIILLFHWQGSAGHICNGR